MEEILEKYGRNMEGLLEQYWLSHWPVIGSGKTEEFWAITQLLVSSRHLVIGVSGVVWSNLFVPFQLYLLFSSNFYGPLCDRRSHIGIWE